MKAKLKAIWEGTPTSERVWVVSVAVTLVVLLALRPQILELFGR